MLSDYDYEYDERPAWIKWAAIAVALALVIVAAFWLDVFPFGGGDGGDQMATAPPATTESTPSTGAPDTVADTTPDTATDTVADTAPDTAADTVADTTPERDAVVATAAATTTAPTSTAAPAVTTTPPPPAAALPSYPVLPDGRPVPVLAIFDGALITLSGVVPDDTAAQRLKVLALANSTDPAAEVASFLTVDPTMPLGVGVRVIEMNSARFPTGSPTISPEHAAQLDRVVAIMSALPHITVDVIGHADQRGPEVANAELSAQRARAAADYVAGQGIDPARLSSRGAGESDLLSLNNDDAALALNRRTEFVFSGLLVDPPVPPAPPSEP